MRRLATALLLVTGLCVAAPQASATTPACTPWRAQQIAKGFGVLENLSFDGTGGLLLSNQQLLGKGSIARLTPDGARSTVVPGVDSPGGQVVAGRTLYFTTGNGIANGILGLLGQASGTISAVDLDTGSVHVVAGGLTMPNGMIRLPDGSFLVSRDIGIPGRTTRVFPDGDKQVFAPSVTSTNGMAYDAARDVVYLDSTFNPTTTISVVDLTHPAAAPQVLRVPGLGPANSADDLALGADGQLYVALNVAGRIVRVDPDSGSVCMLASGLPLSSSLRFGRGPGWDPASLYVTSFLGTVTRLSP